MKVSLLKRYILKSTMSIHVVMAALLPASAILSLTGCDIKPISELTADDGIVRLRGLHKDENWERLIQEVNEYRSRYPYSQYATEAELLQADAYFKTNRLPEAIANYEDFLRRNPSHSQADFALFRIAKSYDLQSPEEIDREQATTQKSIDKYVELSQKFPRSTYSTETQERTNQLKKRIAEHHFFIGNFYWKKELYHAALTRYLYVADHTSNIKDLQSMALTRAAEAYIKLSEQLEKNPKSDSLIFFKSTTPAELKQKSQQLLERKKALSSSSSTEPSKNEG